MNNSLQQGIAAFKAGNKAEARRIFISFIKQNPQSEPGWEWMYKVSLNNKERIHCLERILQINPGNQKAKQRHIELLGPSSQTEASSSIVKTSKNSIPTARANLRILAGVMAGFFLLAVCSLLAVASTQLASQKNHLSYACFFRSLRGEQVCNLSSPAATQPGIDPPFPTGTPVFSAMGTMTFTPTVTFMPTSTAMPARAFTPTNLPTFVSSYTPLPADAWRKWPIVPEFSSRAQQILYAAVRSPNLDSHTFVKVGDCQMSAGIFLAGYVNGNYQVPEGYQQTVEWFSESMVTDDITAVNGYGINTVLDSAFGLPRGHDQCLANETPLDCELRTRRPIVVLVGMGTNWIPKGEVSFERHLREVVDTILKTGALPVLATKADNVEGDWKLNQVIAQVAYDNDLPLVNVWLSVQELPNHGLEKPPRQVYLTGDGWMKRNYAWLVTLEHVRAVLTR